MQENKVGEHKLFSQFGHFSLLVFFCIFFTNLNAASFSEFKRSQSSAFEQYKDEKDKAFSVLLKSNWEEYTAKKSIALYEIPKPTKIISTRKKDIKKLGPKVHINLLDTIKKPKVIKVQKTSIAMNKDIDFDFFGKEIGLDIPNKIRLAKFYPQNQKGIRNFFNNVAALEYENFIGAIKKVMLELNLNDWGKYLLVKNITENIYASQNDARLLSWFIFNKLGYSLKVGLASRQIVLMYNSQKIIYNTPRYTIDSKKFYILSNYAKGRIAKLYTYKHDYPKAQKPFNLTLESLPNLGKDMQKKKLLFNQYGNDYEISYAYNQNMIDFMATYPQADYETFFNAPLENKSYEDIANGLRKYINGKSSSEAINFVLHFVQNAFKYEVDARQFGREKVMFAQETLYYSKSDCEDRAILFANLVKKLFKIGVVGVKYKDHMATALYIPMKGDSVRVNSRKFIIADPTYINANIGQSMQKYKSKKPKSFVYLKKVGA